MAKRLTWLNKDLEQEEVVYATVDNEDLIAVFAKESNLVSSKLDDGLHSPVLDIDFQAKLLGSTTPGHYHLYLDGITLPWWKYRLFLRACAFVGVIEKGYYNVSVRRRQTLVRQPWVKKQLASKRRPATPRPTNPAKVVRW